MVYDNKIENRAVSTSVIVMEHSSNESTPNLTSLIEEIHKSLLRENSKIHSMHSNILSLETQVKRLESIVLELDTKPMHVSESEILENTIHQL